jgi:hypothetical protein
MMRITLPLDGDVAVVLERLRKQGDASLKELVKRRFAEVSWI